MEQLVGYNRVIHPHTSLIEDAENGLAAPEFLGKLPADRPRLFRQPEAPEGDNVRNIMMNLLSTQPRLKSAQEELITKIGAPQRTVADAGLGERCSQIQQTSKARPLAAPVCNCEDRTSVSVQSGENVMAILPD